MVGKWDEVIKAVLKNMVTVVRAQTGAGKTTEIPLALAACFKRVLVTNQRRVAVTSVATYVAQTVGCDVGDRVGYALGRGASRYGSKTQILYATEGVEVIREILGSGSFTPDVVVLDEVHMWTVDGEVILGMLLKRIMEGDPTAPKLVLMSATVDVNLLQERIGSLMGPPIDVPGRTFPIEVRKPTLATYELPVEQAICADVAGLVNEGRNILVFAPGKREIDRIMSALKIRLGEAAEIISMHGDLDDEDQRRAWVKTPKPKVIVATNIAETSITIPDVSAVVDTGLERRIETLNGNEGLYLALCSETSQVQRMGRAGRTAPGVYVNHVVNASGMNGWVNYDLGEQERWTKPEIQRRLLDQMVLRLRCRDVVLSDLPLIHPPDQDDLKVTERVLHNLDLVQEDGKITLLGRSVSSYPTSVRWGLAIHHAKTLGCVADVVLMSCAIEVGGLFGKPTVDSERTSAPFYDKDSAHWTLVRVLRWARGVRSKADMVKYDLIPSKVFRALDAARELARSLGVNLHQESDRQPALDCMILSHHDLICKARCKDQRVFLMQGSFMRNTSQYKADLSFDVGSRGLSVGHPLSISTMGGDILTILKNPTVITPEDLTRVVPQRIVRERVRSEYDGEQDVVVDVYEERVILQGFTTRDEFRQVSDDSNSLFKILSGAVEDNRMYLLGGADDTKAQREVLSRVASRYSKLSMRAYHANVESVQGQNEIMANLKLACEGKAKLQDLDLNVLDVGSEMDDVLNLVDGVIVKGDRYSVTFIGDEPYLNVYRIEDFATIQESDLPKVRGETIKIRLYGTTPLLFSEVMKLVRARLVKEYVESYRAPPADPLQVYSTVVKVPGVDESEAIYLWTDRDGNPTACMTESEAQEGLKKHLKALEADAVLVEAQTLLDEAKRLGMETPYTEVNIRWDRDKVRAMVPEFREDMVAMKADMEKAKSCYAKLFNDLDLSDEEAASLIYIIRTYLSTRGYSKDVKDEVDRILDHVNSPGFNRRTFTVGSLVKYNLKIPVDPFSTILSLDRIEVLRTLIPLMDVITGVRSKAPKANAPKPTIIKGMSASLADQLSALKVTR